MSGDDYVVLFSNNGNDTVEECVEKINDYSGDAIDMNVTINEDSARIVIPAASRERTLYPIAFGIAVYEEEPDTYDINGAYWMKVLQVF